jgi:sodium transport system permease protein
MVLLFPLIVTTMPGIELNAYLSFVPISNSALLVRAIFLGEWHADMLFLTLLSSLGYAALALIFAARVYERNTLLLGGKESFRSFLEFKRIPGDRPTPGLSVLLFTLTLVFTFYGSLALAKQGIPVTLTVVEYGFFLLPAVGIAVLKGYDLKETFSLRLPGWSGALGAALLGISAWTVAGGLLVRLFPPPESFARAMQKAILMEDQRVSTVVLLLLVAVSPALCEEAFFRGIVMSGFRRLGKWPAIVATAFLFGLAHASIYRLLPAMALGVLIGYTVWCTRSIFAGMIVHLLNNGLIVVMAKFKLFHSVPGWRATDTNLPWIWIAVGGIVAAAGVALIARENRAGNRATEPQQV